MPRRREGAAAQAAAPSNRPLTLHVSVSVPDETLDRFRAAAPGARITYQPDSPYGPPSDQAPLLAEAEVVLGYHAGFDLAVAPQLRWYHVAADGVDHLRGTPIMRSPEILVTNTRCFGTPIAEYVFASALAFLRDFPRMHSDFQQHRRWPRNQWEEYCGQELAGKTMAIIGHGEIGRALARRALASEMQVVGVRRSIDQPTEQEGVLVYPPSALHDVLGHGDIVVVALPLTAETDGLIGEPELRAMKRSAYLVTVGRGRVIQEPALLRALREGWIAGAGLDVYAEKPLPESSPFFDLPNVLMTPHMSGVTVGFPARLADLFCDNLRRYLEGETLVNLVDKRRGY